jgi:hypothetical protein
VIRILQINDLYKRKCFKGSVRLERLEKKWQLFSDRTGPLKKEKSATKYGFVLVRTHPYGRNMRERESEKKIGKLRLRRLNKPILMIHMAFFDYV